MKNTSARERSRRAEQSRKQWLKNNPKLAGYPQTIADTLPTAHRGRIAYFGAR